MDRRAVRRLRRSRPCPSYPSGKIVHGQSPPISDQSRTNRIADICLWRKSKNQVHMIRHDGGCMDPPKPRIHAMQDRVSDSSSGFRRGERHQTPILDAAGHKKHGSVNIHPERKIVGQGLAAGSHGTTLWKTRVGIKSKKGSWLEAVGAKAPIEKTKVGMDRRAVLLLRRSRPCLAETALRALNLGAARRAAPTLGNDSRFRVPMPKKTCRVPRPTPMRREHPAHPLWGKWFYLAC